MRRGLKAEAERAAAAARKELKTLPLSPLDPWAYARHLGIVVLDLHKLDLPSSAKRQLLVIDSEGWSAMTIRESAITAIIVNPSHKITRQRSNLAHEIAHFELKHLPSRVEVSRETGMLILSDYSEDQELEADWHGAALLLPHDALAHHRARQKTIAEIATLYGVSESLCEWRLRMTGVDVQLRRAHFR